MAIKDRFMNWGTRLKPGIPFSSFPWDTWNRIINVLENISVRGGWIKKTKNGMNWEIVVDGAEGPGGVPLPFDMKQFFVSDGDGGGEYRLFIYVPQGIDDAVRVNGAKVQGPLTPTEDAERGWFAPCPVTGDIWLTFSASGGKIDFGNRGTTLRWQLVSGEPNPGDPDFVHAIHIATASVDTSGSMPQFKVVQHTHGTVDITVPIFDSDESNGGAYCSIDRNGTGGAAQLYRFKTATATNANDEIEVVTRKSGKVEYKKLVPTPKIEQGTTPPYGDGEVVVPTYKPGGTPGEGDAIEYKKIEVGGYSGDFSVISNVAWDSATGKLLKSGYRLYYTKGVLKRVVTIAETEIFTAIECE